MDNSSRLASNYRHRRERWVLPLLATAVVSWLFTHLLTTEVTGSWLAIAGVSLLTLRVTHPDLTIGSIAVLLWVNTQVAANWSPISFAESIYVLSVVGALVGLYVGTSPGSRLWLLLGVFCLLNAVFIGGVAVFGLVLVPISGWLLSDGRRSSWLKHPVVWLCLAGGLIFLLGISNGGLDPRDAASLKDQSALIGLGLGLLPWSIWVPLVVAKHSRRLNRPSMRSNRLPTMLLVLWAVVPVGYIALFNAAWSVNLIVAGVPICVLLAAMLEDASRLKVSVMMTLVVISLLHAVLSAFGFISWS